MQELDLQIHRPGKHIVNADVLSRFPLSVAVESSPQNVVAAVTDAGVPAKNGEPNRTFTKRQKADPELQMLQTYLEDWTLPHNEAQAYHVVLTHGQYPLIEPDKTLCVIPPATDREEPIWWPRFTANSHVTTGGQNEERRCALDQRLPDIAIM